jgi:hypothetical protein
MLEVDQLGGRCSYTHRASRGDRLSERVELGAEQRRQGSAGKYRPQTHSPARAASTVRPAPGARAACRCVSPISSCGREPPIRPAALAGTFYPAEPDLLTALVDRLVRAGRTEGPPPKAVIASHAGYAFSGPVAGAAYARVSALRGRVERVVVMGPAHDVGLAGLAVSGADGFATTLGVVAVDEALRRYALDLSGVFVSDSAHADEHALEVQLPFLQRVLGAIRILPLLVGGADTGEVAGVLEALWGGPGPSS